MARTRGPPETLIEVAGVQVVVTRKRVKNLNLRIHPPHGEVRLSAPMRTPDAVIRELVRDRLDWIARHRSRIRNLPRPPYKEYVPGEAILVLGERRTLRFAPTTSGPTVEGPGPGDAHAVRTRPGHAHTAPTGLGGARAAPIGPDVVIRVPLGATREARKRAVDRWLRREAKREFAAAVARWEPRMGVRVRQMGVKRMKTRWGTCNPTAGRVWLNLALIERPPECLEYVVVHELAHLSFADHSPSFWAVVDHHLPGWRAAKRQLARAPLWLDGDG